MIENEFKTYGLSDHILQALEALRYMEPTDIQRQIIPYALKDRDVVGKAQTGTGKTAAFAIPLCEKVIWDENKPQALVLEPTRELAFQVRDEIFHIGRKKRLKVPVLCGGFPVDKQILSLKQKSHIVVGTPGRVLDHFRRNTICGSQIKYLIIDEADYLLDMGFIEEVREIMEYIPQNRVTMLFSATFGAEITYLVQQYMSNPVEIVIEGDTETVQAVEQKGYLTEAENKFHCLRNVLIEENPESCMIFCATREMVNTLYQKLKRERISAAMLHGMLDQQERIQTTEQFRNGKFRYLIATDVAARGVDFDELTLVVNYDIPTSKENYVHRAGRTARNGKAGKVITIFSKEELKVISAIEEYTGVQISRCEQVPVEANREKERKFYSDQNKQLKRKNRRGEALEKNITRIIIGGGKKSKIRASDIVGTICSIEGIKSDDIGIVDIRESFSQVEILNGKGMEVAGILETKTLKGKVRKIRTGYLRG